MQTAKLTLTTRNTLIPFLVKLKHPNNKSDIRFILPAEMRGVFIFVAKPQILAKSTVICHSERSEESVRFRLDIVWRFIISVILYEALCKRKCYFNCCKGFVLCFVNIKRITTSVLLSYRSFDYARFTRRRSG